VRVFFLSDAVLLESDGLPLLIVQLVKSLYISKPSTRRIPLAGFLEGYLCYCSGLPNEIDPWIIMMIIEFVKVFDKQSLALKSEVKNS
jgi:hypothetical protein